MTQLIRETAGRLFNHSRVSVGIRSEWLGEMFIVSIYGFPPEAFPIIATIGYLVDPPATMINASGDTIASMLVARLVEGKDWILKGKNNTETV